MKRRNIILAVLVVLVWAFALRTMFSKPEIPKPAVRAKTTHSPVAADEGLMIDENSRDPFLSILSDTAATPDTIRPVSQEKKEVEKKDLPRYCGFIANGKEKLAILELTGKYYFVREKDKLPGYVVKKIKEEWLTLKTRGGEMKIEIHKKTLPHYVMEH